MSDMINLIKQLRDRTGAGLMDCKKALLENNNNVDAACDWLREKGIAKQAKKASTRIAAEGIAWVLAEGNKAAIIEVNSETDFVANSDPFRALVKEVNSLVLANAPKTLDEAKELKNADGKSIADLFVDATVKLGEKLDFRRFEVVEKADDEVFGPYIHMNGKIATLVVLKGGNAEVANGVALNVCSNNPAYVNETDIPAEVIAKETAVQKEAANNDPSFAKKPAAIQDKIIAGKVNKVLFDSVLVDEPFIFDDSKTVGQYLKENNACVVKTVRYAVGEGIEKRQDDFAAEVAAQASAGK
jgi:elongation factor Ts